MAFVNPWVMYIGVPILIFLSVLRFKKKDTYKEGKKVANASLIEDTPYFKKLYKEYKCLCIVALIALLIAIALSFVLLARPARIDTVNPEIHNRDIFLCMDISDSVDELNLDICDKLKQVVEQLDGERFGISIFNGQSVLLVPLTNDYEYVLDALTKMEEAFKQNIGDSTLDDMLNGNYDWDSYYYKYGGTLAEEGSSFIGDGLISALYSFPDLENNNDRSRMIIFTTDNDLNGEPLVTIEEAAALCKKNDVKVFAVAPEYIVDEDVFKKAMLSTGGGYYKATSDKVYDKMVEDIKKTDTSLAGIKQTETIITDQPKAFFVWILICFGVYLFVTKKLKL